MSSPPINLDFIKASKIRTNVVIYTCKNKNNILIESVLEQEIKIKRFINAFNWSLIKIYNYGDIDIENPLERKEFSLLMNDINSGKLNGYKIIIYTTFLIYSPHFNIHDFVYNLNKRKMSLVIADIISDTADTNGLFTQQMSSAVTKYRDSINSKILLIYGGNFTEKFPSEKYRGSIIIGEYSKEDLKNIIETECKEDTWIEIISLKNMKRLKLFECGENETLSMNFDKIYLNLGLSD